MNCLSSPPTLPTNIVSIFHEIVIRMLTTAILIIFLLLENHSSLSSFPQNAKVKPSFSSTICLTTPKSSALGDTCRRSYVLLINAAATSFAVGLALCPDCGGELDDVRDTVRECTYCSTFDTATPFGSSYCSTPDFLGLEGRLAFPSANVTVSLVAALVAYNSELP